MIELTDREKKIILVKYIIHGVSPFADASLDKRIKMLKHACSCVGFDYKDDELQELGRACLDYQGVVNAQLLNFVTNNSDIYNKAMEQINKGNDSIEKLMGKDWMDDAIKRVKGKMKT